jgi:dTDP-4-amino-4,6-dideoxygalactose transaminase
MTAIITKAASDAQSYRRPLLFYRSAREGFADLLRQRLAQGADGVLLPAFIGWSPREGSGVFDPVREVGAHHAFYDLNDDLTVNLHALSSALAKGDCRTLVLIHYFGRTEPRLAQVRDLAAREGVLLIEDLAHGFFSDFVGGEAGSAGGASLYSLHKMLPFQDGGAMSYRDATLILGQRETAPELARAVLDYDWKGIAAHRRATFDLVAARLAALPEHGAGFEMLWPDLRPGDVPQTLPVRVIEANRDDVYHQMNAEGYGMTSLYHTLIPELGDRHPSMTALSRRIINFPVHQDVAAEHVDGMVRSFQKALLAR